MPEPLIKLTERLGSGQPEGTLTLPFEQRQRSRLRARLDDGREAAIVLERGSVLRGGDLLGSAGGPCVEIVAGAEPVSVARTTDRDLLARAAYHLGNRHVPLQVTHGELRYLNDHVLDAMVSGLGLSVRRENLPFEPEAGAYAGGHGHSH